MIGCFFNSHLIAYHETEEAVENYVENIERLYNKRYTIKRIKKESAKKIRIAYPELHLEKYEFVYMRVCDHDYLNAIDFTPYVNEIKLCQQVLYETLKRSTITEKQRSRLKKAIEVLDDISFDDETSIPDDQMVSNYLQQIEQFYMKLDKE